jgi:hypothetical protein
MPGTLTRALLAIAVGACTGVAVPAALADASSGPVVKVGPGQAFGAMVNGKASKAVIRVLCPGTARTGHPLARQAVQTVLAAQPNVLPRSPGAPFTGTAATVIDAWLTWPAATPPPPAYIATLTSVGTAGPIPTGITVPCSGSGEMLFLPAPGSPTAGAATVIVTFARTSSAVTR